MKLNYIKPELTEEIIVLDDVIASSTGTVGDILPGDQEGLRAGHGDRLHPLKRRDRGLRGKPHGNLRGERREGEGA